MAGRWSVWNDEAILALARRCVPAADEVWRLQRGDDPEARFFQGIADAGHYRQEGQTRQGIYLIAPGGRLLASVNSLEPGVVRETIRVGLEAWDALDNHDRTPTSDLLFTARARWEDDYPEGGLVLRATIRDLPTRPDDERVRRYNMDHVWVAVEEVRARLPADLEAGDTVTWPGLAERLACFHLVDSALGQTLPYAAEELQRARLTMRVRSTEGGVALLDIEGETAADADGVWRLGENDWKPERPWPRSMAVALLGSARFQLARRRFEAFDLVGVGAWSGRTRFNGRENQEGGRVGFVFELAPDTPMERVAPAFVDIYDDLEGSKPVPGISGA